MATLQVTSELVLQRATAFEFGQREGDAFADAVAFMSGVDWKDVEHVKTLGYEYRLGYICGKGLNGRVLDRAGAIRLHGLKFYKADAKSNDGRRDHDEQALYNCATQAWSRVTLRAGAPSLKTGEKRGTKATKVAEPVAEPVAQVAVNPLANPQEAVFAMSKPDSIAEFHDRALKIAALINATMARWEWPVEYAALMADFSVKVGKIARGVSGDAVKPQVESKPIPAASKPSAKALKRMTEIAAAK